VKSHSAYCLLGHGLLWGSLLGGLTSPIDAHGKKKARYLKGKPVFKRIVDKVPFPSWGDCKKLPETQEAFRKGYTQVVRGMHWQYLPESHVQQHARRKLCEPQKRRHQRIRRKYKKQNSETQNTLVTQKAIALAKASYDCCQYSALQTMKRLLPRMKSYRNQPFEDPDAQTCVTEFNLALDEARRHHDSVSYGPGRGAGLVCSSDPEPGFSRQILYPGCWSLGFLAAEEEWAQQKKKALKTIGRALSFSDENPLSRDLFHESPESSALGAH